MNALLDEVEVLEVTGDPSSVEVRGIAYDSRTVTDGSLFCCLPGRVTDGHDHAREAVARGAVALLCEHLVPSVLDRPVSQVRVAPGAARPAMARMAAAFYGFPSRQLLMAGVTGTNGKTTVTHLLASVLTAAGTPTVVIGTLSGARTTPESVDLQAQLADVRDAAVGDGRRHAVAMEVSSHALVQSRVDGVRFDVALFTNLSHDHLDYHETMEAYFEAKATLFTPERAALGVVNADDPWGRRLLAQAAIPTVAVHPAQAADRELVTGGSVFTWRGERVRIPLAGSFNVDNALLAAEAAVALGLEPAAVAEGLAAAEPVPGRLEVVAGPSGGVAFTVVVDYAHTPAGLETVLAEARALSGPGRVILVFGAGGNRDRDKRPLMGAAARRGADLAVLTSDNPRDEDPAAIIEQVRAGADRAEGGRLLVVADRREAIATALDAARSGDVVVVAGKGHEAYQEVAGERLPFDDRQVVRSLLGAPAVAPGRHGTTGG